MPSFSNKSLRSRSTLSMLSVSITILLGITSLLFIWFRSELLQGYHRLAEAALGHIEAAFSQRLSDARLTVGKWYQSADGQSFCGDLDTTFVQHMSFINNTHSLLESTGYYQSVCFINRERQSALYVATGVSLPDHPEAALLARAEAVDAKNQPFIWNASRQYSSQETLWYLAVPIADFSFREGRFTGMAVLNIDLRQFQKSLMSGQTSSEFQICILDREGTVLCHSDTSLIGSNFQEEAWVKSILADEHRFFAEQDGTRYEFLSSGLAQYGFAVAIMSEYAAHAGTLDRTANITIAAIVIAALLQICLILMVSRRIFNPFSSVVSQMKQAGPISGTDSSDASGDEVSFLRQYTSAVSSQIQQLTQSQSRDFIVKNLLLGLHQDAVQQLLRESRIVPPGKPFIMVLVSVESADSGTTMQEYDRIRATVNQLLQDEFSRYRQSSCLEISLRRSLFFLISDENDSGPDLSYILSETLKAVDSIPSIRVYLAVSKKLSDQDANCVREFQHLSNILKTAVLLRRTLVTDGTEFLSGKNDSSSILKAVKSRDEEAYRLATDTYLDTLPCVAWEEFLPVLTELAFAICRIGGLPARTVSEEVAELGSRAELLEWLDDLFQRTANHKPASSGRTTAALMEETVDYIRSNPDDSNLSVNMLADRLHITPAYFGKLFQEFTGLKTLDYILQVRMERAKVLLLTDPRTDISDIARQIGYHNSTYFTTAFKKYSGETPSGFRDRCLTEKDQNQSRSGGKKDS